MNVHYTMTSANLTQVFKREDVTPHWKVPSLCKCFFVLILYGRRAIFLKCECLLYKRCGNPCSHVLKITNEIEASMIKVQHWKIYPVHFGSENDMLSDELMKLSIQCGNENMGIPISEAIYHGCKKSWMIRMILTYMFILNYFNLTAFNINMLFFIIIMWTYSNCTHKESQYAYTSDIGQVNLPIIYWRNIQRRLQGCNVYS